MFDRFKRKPPPEEPENPWEETEPAEKKEEAKDENPWKPAKKTVKRVQPEAEEVWSKPSRPILSRVLGLVVLVWVALDLGGVAFFYSNRLLYTVAGALVFLPQVAFLIHYRRLLGKV